jgi:hypothetical protein
MNTYTALLLSAPKKKKFERKVMHICPSRGMTESLSGKLESIPASQKLELKLWGCPTGCMTYRKVE